MSAVSSSLEQRLSAHIIAKYSIASLTMISAAVDITRCWLSTRYLHCPTTGPIRSKRLTLRGFDAMTYCTGILVREGLVLIADTRMSAGPDNLSTYRKLHMLVEPGERALAIATSGNLAVSQAVLNLVDEGLRNPESGEVERLATAPTMFRAAQLIGRAIRHVRVNDSEAFDWARVAFDVSILVGGQIKGDVMRLYMIYPAGNFIESGQGAPFLQIGEHKYGKAVLNRAITGDVDLYDALKVGLVSMDDALNSNVEVGLPIDIAVLKKDQFCAEVAYRIEPGEPYFHDLRERWAAALRAAHRNIPRPPYLKLPPRTALNSLTSF
jgi:putative proteasome-type protease